MSESVPIIGTVNANGQPLIMGMALSPKQQSFEFTPNDNKETTVVEVHETVQLVTLASDEEDEEEGDIDLRMEEMDRLEPIDEEFGEDGSESERMKMNEERGGGGVELMATISEEEHSEGKERQSPKMEVPEATDRPTFGREFSEEEKIIIEEETKEKEEKHKEEEKEKEETKEKQEVPQVSSGEMMRKITKEEDEAMQELLKELDEGSQMPSTKDTEGGVFVERRSTKITVIEEEKEPEVPMMMATEETITKSVTINNDVQACTSAIAVEATILEDNNVAAEPIGPVKIAPKRKEEKAEEEKQIVPVAVIPAPAAAEEEVSAPEQQPNLVDQPPAPLSPPPTERQKTPPPPIESGGSASPLMVKMRQKTIEKQQAIVEPMFMEEMSRRREEEEEKKKPIEFIVREEKRVEVIMEEERRGGGKKPEEQINIIEVSRIGNDERETPERVEEIELRKAMEELQEIAAAKPKEEGQQRMVIIEGTRNDILKVTERKEDNLHHHHENGNGEGGMANGQLNGGEQQPQRWATANNRAKAIFIEQRQIQPTQPMQQKMAPPAPLEKENARPVQIHLLQQQQHQSFPQSQQHSLPLKLQSPAISPASSSTMNNHHPHQHQHNGHQQQLHSTTPATSIQNGGTLPRGPGTRSPFGTLDSRQIEEDWRLSPKTLSRIKRLKVVMEPEEEMMANGGGRVDGPAGKDAGEVIHHHPVFVKDTSRFWYKPTISREEAIGMLKNKPPGTFVVRDSNSFPGAFGLALKVAQPPPGVTPTDGSELVRHFLIEPSNKGVRLKGCSNEPVFGTLAALVYQHSITPLALPCRLILPEYDPASSPEHLNTNQALLERGAACNVTYLCSVDTESLTGPEAVRRSAAFIFELLQRRELRAVPVHFKVSSQGVTLTDNTRSLFFRRHYPVNSVTFAGIDPESRVFDNNNVAQLPPTYVRQAPVFGFVARKNPANGYNGSVENSCHIFAELDPDQPASAVVRFITNVMMPAGRSQLQQIHQNANIH